MVVRRHVQRIHSLRAMIGAHCNNRLEPLWEEGCDLWPYLLPEVRPHPTKGVDGVLNQVFPREMWDERSSGQPAEDTDA